MASCDTTPGLRALDDALADIVGQIIPITESEYLDLAQADGRVLSADVLSTMAVPPADNSAMDGYAVRIDDLSEFDWLKVVQRAMAGDAQGQPLAPGTCARIMTGALIPPGADTVIMQEDAETGPHDTVRFRAAVKPGANIRRAGEEVEPGQQLLSAGRRLRAADLGLLASIGVSGAKVVRRIRVALMATGNELLRPGMALLPGQIYESNSFVIAALLRRMGCEVIDFGIVPDNLDALRQAFANASAKADLVISSGGVSVGEADFSCRILAELGHVDVWKLAIKPGKPFAFGRLPDSWYVGLPGNPVSAMITFHQLVVPLLRSLAGEEIKPPLKLDALVDEKIRKRPGRTDFQRAIVWKDDEGVFRARALPRQSSSLLTTMSQSDAYIVLNADSPGVDAGEYVKVILFDGLLT